MIKLESLLKQVSEIVAIEKTQQEEKRKRGENFNIFNVLGLSTSEVRLHSAFLAELLNPNGDHGLGYKFLEAFLSIIIQQVKPGFEFDIKSAKVRKEFSIGPISEDYTEGGQIDLLIQDKDNHTIVIENKINAGDQYKQLLRYHKYAMRFSQKFVLLYLTKFGTGAEEYSAENIDYKRIGYKNNILPWLQYCLCIAAVYPIIRETIRQYITNLKQITNIMSEDNKKELLELLKKNLSATVCILEVEEEIKKEVRRKYINQVITKLAIKNGFDIRNDFNEFLDLKNDSIVMLKPKEENKSSIFGSFVLRMYTHGKAGYVYYGIQSSNHYKDEKGEKIWNHDDPYFPFGWQYLDNGESLSNWNITSTIIQLQKETEMDEAENIEGTIAKEIDDALKVVKEKNLLKQLDKLCEGQK